MSLFNQRYGGEDIADTPVRKKPKRPRMIDQIAPPVAKEDRPRGLVNAALRSGNDRVASLSAARQAGLPNPANPNGPIKDKKLKPGKLTRNRPLGT